MAFYIMSTTSLENIPEDILSLNFEQAMAELENTVKRLESGQVSLDESVNVYTRGTALRRYCAFKLEEAEAKIDKLIVNKDGSVDMTDFAG